MAAIGTTWAGHAMPKQMTLRRLEMAETRTNYAPHVSGKHIQNRDSIHCQILQAATFSVLMFKYHTIVNLIDDTRKSCEGLWGTPPRAKIIVHNIDTTCPQKLLIELFALRRPKGC